MVAAALQRLFVRQALLLLLASAGVQPCFSDAAGLTLGGDLTLTSEYIYRGVAESDGHAAIQADLHAALDEYFIGVWSSSRDRSLYPYALADVEPYVGRRFALSSTWSASVSARVHYFAGGTQPTSDDYDEITAAVTYLDIWTLSVTAIPNAVRYWYYERLGRAPAWVADTSGQWLLGAGVLLTAGAGYYRTSALALAPTPYPAAPPAPPQGATGYAYGNAGLAWERGRWRLELGYFLTQGRAQQLFPYPTANQHVAGSVTWRF